MNKRATQILVRAWMVALLSTLALVSCDAGTYDGPMKQLEGRPIDSRDLQILLDTKATTDEVIQKFGQPTTKTKSNEADVFTYRSVRGRTSHQSILGIKHSESTQRLVETWILSFREGRLHDAHHSDELK